MSPATSDTCAVCNDPPWSCYYCRGQAPADRPPLERRHLHLPNRPVRYVCDKCGAANEDVRWDAEAERWHCNWCADDVVPWDQMLRPHEDCADVCDTLAAEVKARQEAEASRDWYRSRVERLQREQPRLRDPERTLVCDVLANGCLLPDPDGMRYGTTGRAALAAMGEDNHDNP